MAVPDDAAELALIAPAFDVSFYLSDNPDIAQAGVDALKHYLHLGWREGRNPSPWFDTARYIAAHDELAEDPINPLVHCLRAGLAAETGGGAPWGTQARRRAVVTEALAVLSRDDIARLLPADLQGFTVGTMENVGTLGVAGGNAPFTERGPDEPSHVFVANGQARGLVGLEDLSAAVASGGGVLTIRSLRGQTVAGLTAICAALAPQRIDLVLDADAFTAPPDAALVHALFDAMDIHLIVPSAVAGAMWARAYPGLRLAGIIEAPPVALACDGEAVSRTTSHLPIAAFVGPATAESGWAAFRRLIEAPDQRAHFRFAHVAAPRDLLVSDRLLSIAADGDLVSALAGRGVEIAVLAAETIVPFSREAVAALAAGCLVVTLSDSGHIASLVDWTGQGLVLNGMDDLLAAFADGRVAAALTAPRRRGRLVTNGQD